MKVHTDMGTIEEAVEQCEKERRQQEAEKRDLFRQYLGQLSKIVVDTDEEQIKEMLIGMTRDYPVSSFDLAKVTWLACGANDGQLTIQEFMGIVEDVRGEMTERYIDACCKRDDV